MSKNVRFATVVGLLCLCLVVFAGSSFAKSPLVGGADKEVYYMVTFLSGADFWKGCFLGMQEAAEQYGVKVIYAGTPEYDITQEVTVFEQIVAQKPTGIALTAMNPEPFIKPIQKAIEQGIKVVTFDTDAPGSLRATFVSTDNFDMGKVLARELAKVMNKKGKIGVMTRPAQLNVWTRFLGFKEELEKNYPDMKIAQVTESQGSEAKAAEAAAALIQANPDLDAIFTTSAIEGIGIATAVKESGKKIRILACDSDVALLDMIKNGEVWATGVQNTYLMGYWSMIALYTLSHNLCDPMSAWKIDPAVSPLPPFINTGVSLATKDNTQTFYLREFKPKNY